MVVQKYDFNVEYCKSADNVVADFFSRNPEGKFATMPSNSLSIDVLFLDDVECTNYKCNQINYTGELNESLKNFKELQKSDPMSNLIRKKLEGKEFTKNFVIEQGILFRFNEKGGLWQIVIPEILTHRLMDCVHSKLGHPGTYKTSAYLSQ